MAKKLTPRNCVSQIGDMHSHVQICDQHIVKKGPAALPINEYVTLFAYSAILGKDNIQLPLDIAFYKNGAAKLTLEKFDNFIPSKIKGGNYPYLNNPKIPTITLATGADIKEDFSGYTLTKSTSSRIGDKEVVGFFKMHLASMLLNEVDTVILVNIALRESKECYTVTRFDTDDSFNFLCALNVIKKSHIEQFYNRDSTSIMFEPLDIGFSPNTLLRFFLSLRDSQYRNILEALPQILTKKVFDLAFSPQKLALEEGFSDFFSNFDIDKINSIIANGFEKLKAITPEKTLKASYNPKKIISLIEKGLLNIKLSESKFEYDYIKFQDIESNQVVQKYCTTTNFNKNQHVLDGVSFITQCMTAIRYALILGTGLCYVGLKHKYDPNFKPDDIISHFPQPDTNYNCYRPALLNSKVCNVDNIFNADPKDIECMNSMDTNFPLCDMIGEFLDVCGNVAHTEL